MSKNRAEQQQKNKVSRRGFLGAGTAAASFAAFGAATPGTLAFAKSAEDERISPGFFAPQYYGSEEIEALVDVVNSGCPFRFYGPGQPDKTNNFEEEYRKYMGAKYGLALTSGTAALDCAMVGVEVGPGDEVIVPAYTWWSDYTCVVNAGALPVFADIDESINMDPKDFERKITPRTKAVIPVHLLGGPADLEPIMEIAKKKGIAVVEDAAQCVGGSYNGKKLGSMGDIGIYSFQLCKMISSGDGGALVSNDPIVFERAVRFHNMGGLRSHFEKKLGEPKVPQFAGKNFRMNEFTGAVLGAQLPKLDEMISGLRSSWQMVYDEVRHLPGLQFRKQPDPKGDIGYGVFFLVENKPARDRCIKELQSRGIPAGTLSGSILLPVAESVMNKRTQHPKWPSFNTPEGKAIQYGPDSCRQTLDLYDRFVQVRLGPKYTENMNKRIIAAIKEVHPMVT